MYSYLATVQKTFISLHGGPAMLAVCIFSNIILTLLSCPQLVWAYVVLSGLSGMALTYYYDNEGNVKLLNILKYGLMLLGIGLVYCSTSMTEASLLLCTLLLSSVPLSLMWEKR